MPSHFWDALDSFQAELHHNHCPKDGSFGDNNNTNCYNHVPDTDNTDNRELILTQIEKLIADLIVSLVNDESLSFSYKNMKNWSNVSFEETNGLTIMEDCTNSETKFDNAITARRFGLMVKMLEIIYKLVQDDSYSTKRDIYYNDVQLFGKQSTVDDLVTCVSCLLGVPRWKLHVLATSKGCVCGDLQYYENGVFVDCNTSSPILVPTHVKAIENLSTNARFVLIVEKDATFQKLVDQSFCEKFAPCIIITGKGFPDVNTRMLLRRLWDEHQLPMFALVDADPHGIEIMAIYKFGSKTLALECEHLAVPTIRWLGVFPSDIHRFQLGDSNLLDMTVIDKRKATSLLKRPYIVNDLALTREIQKLLNSGKKAEIQSLNSISSTFLTDVYIPGKLQHAGWI